MCSECHLPIFNGVHRWREEYFTKISLITVHEPRCRPPRPDRIVRTVVHAKDGTIESDTGLPPQEDLLWWEAESTIEAAKRRGERSVEIHQIKDSDSFWWRCGKWSTYSFFSHTHGRGCLHEDLRLQWRLIERHGFRIALNRNKYDGDWTITVCW